MMKRRKEQKLSAKKRMFLDEAKTYKFDSPRKRPAVELDDNAEKEPNQHAPNWRLRSESSSLSVLANRYLEDCKSIGHQPVSAIVKVFKEHGKQLALRHRGVGSKGAQALAQSLISSTSITDGHFRSNSISLDGGIAFADALQK